MNETGGAPAYAKFPFSDKLQFVRGGA